ncbi:UDP-glycosyltransferase 90A1-like [Mangifera indica]|uniref:UDP-glycosyltransferase 90A1-like n=1 Tax=Mangifera indica TaxID=29780 RepID=UPI001CFBB956|nr:UDP-glycosyltransferase 90A1-like [Mangifera indica]
MPPPVKQIIHESVRAANQFRHQMGSHHVVLFPFMSKGHTIPILHLAQLLLRRPHVAVTFVTTPANRPFVDNFLANTTASIVNIPFPQNVPGIGAGVESTDKLPSMSLYVPFTKATKLMQPDFERELEALPRVSFMVSDSFLWWTLESAEKFGFPRFAFYGMGNYAQSVSTCAAENRLLTGPESLDDLITVTDFPWIKITRNDFDPLFNEREPKGPAFELLVEQVISVSSSYGMIVNSFYELEPGFVDYWNRVHKLKASCVGPLCLAELPRNELQTQQKPAWIQWLDKKFELGSSVLYVAFGSQAEISPKQLKEIATGLEESKVNFLWVLRKEALELDGFEERVKERGLVVREWVDQREILMHRSVQGFLSHCGWNSVMESIVAGVPILAWPMMAEQPLNARFVVEEIKIGIRVETSNGSVKGFVKWESLEKTIKELMEGEMGKETRNKVKKYSEMAKNAVEEQKGSSWPTLETIINETRK